MGERDADEARRTSQFSARIAPIPAFGTKRVEMEYQERLEFQQGDAFFTIPLRPDVYRVQAAGYATKRTTKLTTVKISKKYGRAICANFTATSYAEARPYACRGSHLRNEGRRRTAAPFNADYLRIKSSASPANAPASASSAPAPNAGTVMPDPSTFALEVTTVDAPPTSLIVTVTVFGPAEGYV